MYYYLDIQDQITKIMSKFTKDDLFKKTDSKDLTDIRDGNIYKKLLASDHGNDFKNQEAFSFLLNTDGISFMRRSKITIWPVFLVINELPIESRFCIDNTILAGLSVGEQKPNIDVFFSAFPSDPTNMDVFYSAVSFRPNKYGCFL